MFVDFVDSFHPFVFYVVNGDGVGNIIDEQDKIAMVYFGLEIGAGGGIDEFGENFLGVDAHFGGKDDFLESFFYVAGNLRDDRVDERTLANLF